MAIKQSPFLTVTTRVASSITATQMHDLLKLAELQIQSYVFL